MNNKQQRFNGNQGRFLLLFISILLLMGWLGQATASLPVATAQQPVEPQSPTIVGGEEAEPGAWPWQVALVVPNSNLYAGQFCGGSLIDAKWVLTAAHCTAGASASQIEVAAGVHNLSNPEPGFQRLGVERIIMHPNYNGATFNFDIALLELETAAVLGQPAGGLPVATIAPVAADVGSLAGVLSTVTGWGNRNAQPVPGGNDFPETLHQVELPIMSDADCTGAYGNRITENMLCAGYLAGGKDSCQGDSGGPLVIFDEPNQRWIQAGVVSWGIGCASPNNPGVYTRLSRFNEWINEHTGLGTLALSITPPSISTCVGNPANYLVNVIPPTDFNGTINLSVNNTPPGATTSFTPPSLNGAGQSALNVTTNGVSAGVYSLQITAATSSLSQSLNAGLAVYSQAPAAPQPQAPVNGATSVSPLPTFSWSATAQTASYRLEIATDSNFSNVIYSTETAETTHTATEALAPNTQYYWRVQSLNPCGTGTFSPIYSFTTLNAICQAANQPIPDADPSGTNNIINISDPALANALINDLNVSIQATHSFVGDLVFSLQHLPGGTKVTLLDQPGVPETSFGCSNDNVDAQFDDEANLAAESACEPDPALSGKLRPNQPLSAFDNQNLAGEWVLTVADLSGGDQGTLVEWCLLVETAQQSVCDDVNEIPTAECQALVSFYEQTNGPNWQNKTDWLLTDTPCGWFGVACDAGHVTELTLPNNNLIGMLPPTISDLAELSELVVANNDLHGLLPSSLTSLNLQTFWYNNTNLCTPTDPAFQSWLEDITDLQSNNRACQNIYLPITR